MKKMVTISCALIVLIAVVLIFHQGSSDSQEFSQAQFFGMVQSNLLDNVRVYYPPEPGQLDGVPVMLHKVRGTFRQSSGNEFPFIARVNLTPELTEKVLAIRGVSIVTPHPFVQKVRDWFRGSP
jgi:hypothetical protein